MAPASGKQGAGGLGADERQVAFWWWLQGKLAQLRNANSEDEVDESLLQLGLLAYPVLQAADVLLYK